MTSDIDDYLRPSPTVESAHDAVIAYARGHAGRTATPREAAVALYYAVRDDVRYDPYTIDLSVDGLRASTTLRVRRGWCVTKAVLLAACCRAVGIAARLGFADVRNHLSTERMRARMQTDLFMWHGYTSIHLDGRWIKATPAFNVELCDRFRLKPLEFDGRSDSIYHPFDLSGARHMEYVRERGEFFDVPIADIVETFRREYSALVPSPPGDFERDVARETLRVDD